MKKHSGEKSFCSLPLTLADPFQSHSYRSSSLSLPPNSHPIYPQPYVLTLAEPQARTPGQDLDEKVVRE